MLLRLTGATTLTVSDRRSAQPPDQPPHQRPLHHRLELLQPQPVGTATSATEKALLPMLQLRPVAFHLLLVSCRKSINSLSQILQLTCSQNLSRTKYRQIHRCRQRQCWLDRCCWSCCRCRSHSCIGGSCYSVLSVHSANWLSVREGLGKCSQRLDARMYVASNSST